MSTKTEDDLDIHLQALKKNPKDFTSQRNLLRHLRSTRLRRSDIVCQYGKILLSQNASQLSEVELWEVHEQVFVAALDVGDNKLADELLGNIKRNFGNGTRVRKLIGMQLEQQEKYEEADKLYSKIIEEDPTNAFIMKRQICIRKAMGDTAETIRLLNEYLKLFMADTDAWQELGDIYLEQQMYKNAAYCYEELILAVPQNFLYFVKYAEILYTLGGSENIKLARKYYALSCEINSTTNTRGLYGLCMAAIALSSTKFGKDNKENAKIFEWGFQKLKDNYNKNCPERLPQLKVLQSLMNKESS